MEAVNNIEVVDVVDIPDKHKTRKRRFDRTPLVYDALAQLSGLPNDKAVRFKTISHFRALNIHTIIRQAAERRNMKVGVRVTDDFTYLWRKAD